MPISRMSWRLKLLRHAERMARETGIDRDAIVADADQQVRFDVERSADLEPARRAERDRAAERAEKARKAIDRREFLRRGATVGAASAVGAGLGLFSPLKRPPAPTSPRIVVVGAGFAGLTAAHRIYKTKGWAPTVYEARTRVGGRAWTNRTFFADGQSFEQGGSGINTNETNKINKNRQPKNIDSLRSELGIGPLVDTWLNYPNGQVDYWYDDVRFSDEQLKNQGLTAAEDTALAQWLTLRWPVTYNNRNANNDRFDSMTADDWISQYVSGGLNSPVGRFLSLNLMGVEYGGRGDDISALHLIMELGGTWIYGANNGKNAFATYDERWAIPGGNDTVATALAGRLPAGAIRYGQELEAIIRNSNGSYDLTFNAGGTRTAVTADRVVMAIAPPCLKNVDRSRAGFDALTEAWISGEPNGTNTKINMQFAGPDAFSQPWGLAHRSGDAITDRINISQWQANFASPTNRYDLLSMNNIAPRSASDPAHAPATADVANAMLAQLDFQYEDRCTPAFTGKCWHDQWVNDPYAFGSYAYYRPGGFTNFGGAEVRRQGSVHFAGEHAQTNYEERGMMNGAVLSGERVAAEVVNS